MKRHSWCEGYLYDRLLTPLADWLISLIVELVPANSRTLEIGCGPGELACRMGKKCKQVTAIDISERMITYAKRKKEAMGVGNVDFVCLPAAEIKDKVKGIFDYAIASLCLHEMNPRERVEAVQNCLDISEKMIVADYQAPFPKSSVAFGNNIMEVLGGPRHHRNFRNWQNAGGIDGFIEAIGLRKIKEIEWKDLCGKIVVVVR
jgi:SAM-dependent methyltransferase